VKAIFFTTMIKIKLRSPSGAGIISLSSDATVADLQTAIEGATQISNFTVKLGFPPKDLLILELPGATPLSETGVKLNGEQLIISASDASSVSSTSGGSHLEHKPEHRRVNPDSPAKFTAPPKGTPSVQPKPFVSGFLPRPELVAKKSKEDEPAEIPVPERGGTLVQRVMPDDNSCLFRAVGTCVLPSADTMNELRSLVAQAIQGDPELYTAGYLGKEPNEYCQWIQNENSGGGGIELAIISQHFDIEICSIDVQNLRVDKFNQGAKTRCFLVYSGIHYDCIALALGRDVFDDEKVFDSQDDLMMEKALELCKKLKAQHYYTDVSGTLAILEVNLIWQDFQSSAIFAEPSSRVRAAP
jgi:ubiquitin thioesterase OTU1